MFFKRQTGCLKRFAEEGAKVGVVHYGIANGKTLIVLGMDKYAILG